jgi:hypothetical protein
LVINQFRAFLADPAAVFDAVDDESHTSSGQIQLTERGRQIAEELGAMASDKVKATLMALQSRVEINRDRIEIHISRHRLAALLAGQSIDPTMQDHKLDRDSDDVMTLVAPARLKRVGREMRMLVENSDDQTAANPSLLRIIARAHDIQKRLIRNTELTVLTSLTRSASRQPTSITSCVFPGWHLTLRRPLSTVGNRSNSML